MRKEQKQNKIRFIPGSMLHICFRKVLKIVLQKYLLFIIIFIIYSLMVLCYTNKSMYTTLTDTITEPIVWIEWLFRGLTHRTPPSLEWAIATCSNLIGYAYFFPPITASPSAAAGEAGNSTFGWLDTSRQILAFWHKLKLCQLCYR